MTALQIASGLLAVAGLYLGLGIVFAAWFAVRGAGRLDSAAARSTWGFRLLVIPGATLLWPLLIARVRRHPPS